MMENKKQDSLSEELVAEIASAERVRQSQLAMEREMSSDPESAKNVARLESGDWTEGYVMGNFHRNLPVEREKWLVGNEPVPRSAKTKDLYSEEEAKKKDADHFPSHFFRTKTWGEFYDDVDTSLRDVGFNSEEMGKFEDQNFRKANTKRLYESYKLLRAKGYSHFDLAR